MPYVPSEKTDGKSQDRKIIDAALEPLALWAAEKIGDHISLIETYTVILLDVAQFLNLLLYTTNKPHPDPRADLAYAIFEVSKKYGYGGAHLGEFNYAFTRFIQRVPQIKVERGEWPDEFRYGIYASTVAAFLRAKAHATRLELDTCGVIEDIKDEYKRRVNTAYEAAQILKSGDCYDTPYYTRLVEVVDEVGNHVGHQEIMLKRSPDTVTKDILEGKIILKMR